VARADVHCLLLKAKALEGEPLGSRRRCDPPFALVLALAASRKRSNRTARWIPRCRVATRPSHPPPGEEALRSDPAARDALGGLHPPEAMSGPDLWRRRTGGSGSWLSHSNPP